MMLFRPWRLWQLSLGKASKNMVNYGGGRLECHWNFFQFSYDDNYEAGLRPWWSQPERHSRCHWHQYEPTCPYDEPAGIVSFHFHNRLCQLDYCWHFYIYALFIIVSVTPYLSHVIVIISSLILSIYLLIATFAMNGGIFRQISWILWLLI